MRFRLLEPRAVQHYFPEDAIRDRIVGEALQLRPELLLGEFALALSPILEAQAGMYPHEVWICRDRRFIFFDGLRSIRHLVIGRTHQDVSRRRVWTYLHDSREYARKCLVLLHPQICFAEHIEGLRIGRLNAIRALQIFGRFRITIKSKERESG